MKFITFTAILGIIFASCTPSQRAEALKDSRTALDKACEVRAQELNATASGDAGQHD